MEQFIAYQCNVFKSYARNIDEYVFNNTEKCINKCGSLIIYNNYYNIIFVPCTSPSSIGPRAIINLYLGTYDRSA